MSKTLFLFRYPRTASLEKEFGPFGAFLHRRKQICRPSMFGTEAECHHHQQLVISLTNGVMSRGSGKAFKPKEVTDGDTSLGRLIFRDLHCFTTCSGTCCLQETPQVLTAI